MAWHRQGGKPLFKPMMVSFTYAYMSLGLNALKIERGLAFTLTCHKLDTKRTFNKSLLNKNVQY